MKKKIIALCLAAIIAVTAVASVSLAYLKDTDAEDNVFTVGNVDIDLYENFVDESKLLPAVYDAEKKVWNNAVTKEVFVTNTGSEAAYVRVHIAIPTILDDGDPSFNASKNVLHFNMGKETYADGLWSWNKAVDGANYPENGGNWNFYTTTIDNVAYNVYVVTFKSTLAAGEATCSAMKQVYLDPKVTNEDIASINEKLNGKWSIYVAAEGVQAAGFANAYEALNTAFGVPGAYTVDWTAAAGVDTTKGN